jgi:hypothetical protein
MTVLQDGGFFTWKTLQIRPILILWASKQRTLNVRGPPTSVPLSEHALGAEGRGGLGEPSTEM